MTLHTDDPLTTVLSKSPNLQERAIATFLQFIEKKTGATLVRDAATSGLQPLFALADKLRTSGVIRTYYRVTHELADEPRMYSWRAAYADDDSAGGSSATSDVQALTSTLAEALERYLWRFDTSTFVRPIKKSEKELRASGLAYVPINRFAGFTAAQRKIHARLKLTDETVLTWIQALDHTGKSIYLPAQTLSGTRDIHAQGHEPLVRPVITTGLATGVTRTNALIAGTLEILERDAFMIMWLNQLTYPRIELAALMHEDEELRELLRRAERYKLQVDVVRMETDAPVHATIAIVQDRSENPTADLIVGMGCKQTLAAAAAHAIHEAFRIRLNARVHYSKLDAAAIVPEKIAHTERVPYWLHDSRWKRLRFLAGGPVQTIEKGAWEKDSPEQYLARLKKWCIDAGYTFASHSLGTSKKNPTPWFVESVVIPELQPLHINERFQCLGGTRLRDIPIRFGYTPRETPFSKEPHPFA